MKKIILAAVFAMAAGAGHASEKEELCGQVKELAYHITTLRDAGMTASTVRAVTDQMDAPYAVRYLVREMIKTVYANRNLTPPLMAAVAYEACISSL